MNELLVKAGNWIRGGWRTYSPGNSLVGPFYGDAGNDPDAVPVEVANAAKLSAWWGCLYLNSEVKGSLPLQIRDKNKNILTQHDLTDLLRVSPNSMQTGPEFWSMMEAHKGMHGNGFSKITRRRDGSIVSLEPFIDPACFSMHQRAGSGAWYYKGPDGQEYRPDELFHLKDFSLNGYMGASRLDIGSAILSAQLTANEAALRGFRQGIKVGGFFKVEQNLDKQALIDFAARLNTYAQPENSNKWMTLLKGMTPIGGAELRMKSQEMELLTSRSFGIEEICRLQNTPPQLIGHVDKASSWASSLENVNLFYLMYRVMPGLIRDEARITKSLMSREDRAKGLQARFNITGLLRGDAKARAAMYASGLQNGYLNQDEVRDMEDRAAIPNGEGQEFRVQMNMAQSTDLPEPK